MNLDRDLVWKLKERYKQKEIIEKTGIPYKVLWGLSRRRSALKWKYRLPLWELYIKDRLKDFADWLIESLFKVVKKLLKLIGKVGHWIKVRCLKLFNKSGQLRLL
ncbi:hypothetical protein GF389_03575 [Candidatus Dojkabacteria bacterium]|nr:hypothetical protein [Candidatus Dojkabacteria bacterium]